MYTYINNYIIAICLLVIALPLPLQAQKTFAASEAQQIMKDIHRELSTYHPFAFRENGRERLDSVYNTFKNESLSEELNSFDILALSKKYNDLLHDGHLSLDLKLDSITKASYLHYNYNSLNTVSIDDKIILLNDIWLADSVKISTGSELKYIESIDASKFVNKISKICGLNDHDHKEAPKYYSAYYIGNRYQNYYGSRDSLLLEFETENSKFVKGYYKAQKSQKNGLSKKDKKINEKEQKHLKENIYLDSTSYADINILRIKTFSTKILGTVFYDEYITKLFEEIKKSKTKGLIIDLRGNTGGSLRLLTYVYEHITNDQPIPSARSVTYDKNGVGQTKIYRILRRGLRAVKKDGDIFYSEQKEVKPNKRQREVKYKNEVVVLQDAACFSAATVFINYLRIQERGITIGQTAGGSAERYFANSYLRKPVGTTESFELAVPLWHLKMHGDFKGNTVPDIFVKQSIDDIKAGKDKSLQTAIDYLKKSIGNS